MQAILIVLGIYLFAAGSYAVYRLTGKRRIKNRIKSVRNSKEVSIEEFFEIRNAKKKRRGCPYYSLSKSVEGVYVVFNKTKNKYYVGQGIDLFNRVNSHFTGKGNGDVYADYKYGDKFTIKMIPLKKSGYKTLNALEKDAIFTYGAYATGYNKTRGNN